MHRTGAPTHMEAICKPCTSHAHGQKIERARRPTKPLHASGTNVLSKSALHMRSPKCYPPVTSPLALVVSNCPVTIPAPDRHGKQDTLLEVSDGTRSHTSVMSSSGRCPLSQTPKLLLLLASTMVLL
jgi:hypothetical protein